MRWHIKLILLAFLSISISTQSSLAIELHGLDEPALQNALDDLMDGDKDKPLHELLRLAENGNDAARLLFARFFFLSDSPSFDYRLYFSDFWLQNFAKKYQNKRGLPDKKAISDWVQSVQNESELSKSIAEMFSPNLHENRAATRRLLEIGEWSLGTYAIHKRFYVLSYMKDRRHIDSEIEFLTKLHDIRLIPDNSYRLFLAILRAQGDEHKLEIVRSFLENSDEFSKNFSIILSSSEIDNMDLIRNDERPTLFLIKLLAGHEYDMTPDQVQVASEAFESAISEIPNIERIARPCERICPNHPMACVRASYGIIASYESMVRNLGTPLSTVIDQDRFLDSKLADATLLKHLAIRSTGKRLDRAQETSQCLASTVSDEIRQISQNQ